MDFRQIILLLVFFIFYVIIGGLVFMFLEAPLEQQMRKETEELLADFRGNLHTPSSSAFKFILCTATDTQCLKACLISNARMIYHRSGSSYKLALKTRRAAQTFVLE